MSETKLRNGRVQIMFTEPSLTKQSFKDECDINQIVKKHKPADLMMTLEQQNGQIYADVSEIPDYQTAMDTIASANQLFASLPAQLRKRFNNDPAEYLNFVQNEENLSEAIKLGLASEKTVPETPVTLVKVVSDESTKEGA